MRLNAVVAVTAILLALSISATWAESDAMPSAGADAAADAAVISAAEKVVADSMKDPDSVKFEHVVVVKETNAVCGKFNAKNSYGAYAGYSLFTVGKDQVPHVFTGDHCAGSDAYQCRKKLMADIKAIQAACESVLENGDK